MHVWMIERTRREPRVTQVGHADFTQGDNKKKKLSFAEVIKSLKPTDISRNLNSKMLRSAEVVLSSASSIIRLIQKS